MTIGAYRLNSLGASNIPIVYPNSGDGQAPNSVSGFSLLFGSAVTVSTAATDVFDTSVVYSNNDISDGAYAVSFGTTSGQTILHARHTARTITLGAAPAVNGSASVIKRAHCGWGLRTGGNHNKRGFTQSQNTASSRDGSYTLVSSNTASTSSAFTSQSQQLLGEMPINGTQWHEWLLNGSTLNINRYTGGDTSSWHSGGSLYSASLSILPMYEFYDAVKTSPNSGISFWYGCSASGIKDMLIVYSSITNTHIIDSTNIFNYAAITSSIAKKGVLLSANINQTSDVNAIGYWDDTNKKLDLKLFSTSTSPSLSVSWGNKYTFSMPGETNVRLMTSHLGCDFCFLLSTNAAGTQTYIRRITASSNTNLTISNATFFSTASGTTEAAIGNVSTNGMLLYRTGATNSLVAFTI